MDWYSLSRQWFDWSFENPEKISPNHTALYFFAIEHCNRLWWRKKFWFPTEMAKDAIGIKSYTTYIKTLNDLVDWGFIEMIERSKNQYSSNIIALSNFDKALVKALDKAIWKHVVKHCESTCESIVSIYKQVPTKKPKNIETIDIEKNREILEKYINNFDNWSVRHTFFSSMNKNIDLIYFQVEIESLKNIEKKLLDFKDKLWDDRTRLELESFWEHHKWEKTEIKSLIWRLNTWLSNKITPFQKWK